MKKSHIATLPFYPFALASPLAAIDHDGYYVKTMQNHSDSALMKRVPHDIIEARQVKVTPDPLTVVAIITGIGLVLNLDP